MRRRQEDLHGYDVLTAIDFALDRVREAYENGYDEIELVHGSAAVQGRWKTVAAGSSGSCGRSTNRAASTHGAGATAPGLGPALCCWR